MIIGPVFSYLNVDANQLHAHSDLTISHGINQYLSTLTPAFPVSENEWGEMWKEEIRQYLLQIRSTTTTTAADTTSLPLQQY